MIEGQGGGFVGIILSPPLFFVMVLCELCFEMLRCRVSGKDRQDDGIFGLCYGEGEML